MTINLQRMENAPRENQQLEQEPSFWVQPQQPAPVLEPVWPRNLVILIFVAFLAGLLLGKVMHPTVLTLKP